MSINTNLSLNKLQLRAVSAINKYLPTKTTRQIYDVSESTTEPQEHVIQTKKNLVHLDDDEDDVLTTTNVAGFSRLVETVKPGEEVSNATALMELITGEFHIEEKLAFSHLPKDDPNTYNFLLLGPAGSGKTTVITNAVDTTVLKVAFCAFTNKATQVLKKISLKHGSTFHADFLTIHKLLALEIKYLHRETEIAFTFDKNKVENLKNYDVIIFDECSTISAELFGYLHEANDFIKFKYGYRIKFIFLGDYWQLPPVGEDTAVVFKNATVQNWPVSKLAAVMRAGNEQMVKVNNRLLKWVDVFKSRIEKPIKSFVRKYPYNLAMKKDHPDMYINHLDDFHDTYMNLWKADPDTVMLTYSKANCQKTNFAIQDIIDDNAKRELPPDRKDPHFFVGDRCCLDKPIEVCQIKRDTSRGTEFVVLSERLGESLYNGEIFDVLYAEDVNVRTPLNKLPYIGLYFPGQLITVRRIDETNPTTTYDIIHIEESIINAARKKIRGRCRRTFYISLFSAYLKFYPKLTYGYCITVYKSQGSEWRNVLVNINSIKWCIVGSGADTDLKKKRALFRTTYTAMSRASQNLKLFWF
jgi:ATP-dependent exoDNAse (exonuclease V) alpha subunit